MFLRDSEDELLIVEDCATLLLYIIPRISIYPANPISFGVNVYNRVIQSIYPHLGSVVGEASLVESHLDTMATINLHKVLRVMPRCHP